MKERRCIGCYETKDAKSMIKLTKDYKTGQIIINPDNYCFGRSIYVCNNENCINSIFKKDKISKNLKKNLTNEEKENIKTVLIDMVVVKH